MDRLFIIQLVKGYGADPVFGIIVLIIAIIIYVVRDRFKKN